MDLSESIAELRASRCIQELPVRDLDRERAHLVCDDGVRYEEISESIWSEVGNPLPVVVYLQTMTHGGGICLKPLYVRLGEEWYNATTGKFAPASLPLPGRKVCRRQAITKTAAGTG